MSTDNKTRPIAYCLPVVGVLDDCIIARDGAVTLGWELFPPEEYGVTQEGYDTLTSLMATAFRSLPPWTMVHRQDVYRRRTYRSTPSGHFLDDCYSAHFEGRPYIEHRQFLWLSFNPLRPGRAGAMKSPLQGSVTGAGYAPRPLGEIGGALTHFDSRCQEFISVLAAAGGIRSRRLRREDLEGGQGCGDGLLEEYLRWFGAPDEGTDIIQSGGTFLDRDTRRMFSHSFSRTDDLPGEVSNTMKVRSLSTSDCDILLSAGAPIGADLPFEHIVNCYYLYPDQQHALSVLDRRMKNMTAMSKGSSENAVNAEGIAHFIDMIHAESTAAVYTHLNILTWGPRDEELTLRGAVGAALSSMGLTGKLNTIDTPQLWLAALPGGEMDIGEDNLYIAELEQAMCLSVGESFIRDFPGGKLRITDRHRHTPVLIDTQAGAYEAKYIENYNAFILGPSGSGKSFFTAWYVRNCYDAGQYVFIIDRGGSYYTLCMLIREETGGRDGVYYDWDPDHPYSFAPLQGCRRWTGLQEATSELSFFISLLKLMWTPGGGWNAETDSVLYRMIQDFIGGLPEEGDDPVFGDFLDFIRKEIRPRILRAVQKEFSNREPYLVGGVEVTPRLFDIDRFCIALDPYGSDGRFAFLLNERHPADLINSRFIVFDVDAISDMDEALYAICTFCIIHAFERKMRSGDDDAFRLLFIEEAWQVIAREGTAEYLRGLWKTARKYHTSATVVTQQISDIISSPVVKDAILNNSPVKILLDQHTNAASFDDISALLGLSPIDRALVRSVGREVREDSLFREVFITLGGKRSGVYALEVSPEEALVYESEFVKKKAVLDLAREKGSLIEAVRTLARERKAKAN